MKYILPKSVYIDRVLVHDKKSLCVVPDMKITLKFEVVKDCFGESADLALRRYFKSKLIDFFDMHPEDMPTQKSTSSYKPAKRVLDFSLMEDNDGLGIEMDKLESIRALHESSRGCSEDCNSFGSVSAPQEARNNARILISGSFSNRYERITRCAKGWESNQVYDRKSQRLVEKIIDKKIVLSIRAIYQSKICLFC
ncbi:hypothetical protein GLYMA_06G062500v4 [Glycine max]|nr:hypothetical protein GLYMA_06G062500v4 [Glycine max]